MDRRYALSSVGLGDATSFTPIGDMVAIKPRKMEDTTESGIIYQEREHERFGDGIVLSIAEGVPDENGNCYPVEFKEGDRVLHDKHAGFHDLGEFIITRRQHIVAILEDDAELS